MFRIVISIFFFSISLLPLLFSFPNTSVDIPFDVNLIDNHVRLGSSFTPSLELGGVNSRAFLHLSSLYSNHSIDFSTFRLTAEMPYQLATTWVQISYFTASSCSSTSFMQTFAVGTGICYNYRYPFGTQSVRYVLGGAGVGVTTNYYRGSGCSGSPLSSSFTSGYAATCTSTGNPTYPYYYANLVTSRPASGRGGLL